MKLADGRLALWLGAEGVAESPATWFREVSERDELDLVLAAERAVPGGPLPSIDGTGRPYWLVEVLPAAPAEVLARAERLVRAVRLIP